MPPRPIQFRPSPEPTIGVEVELQLIDPVSGELACGAPELLDMVPESERLYFKAELYQCCIEINTPICNSVAEAEQHLRKRIHEAQRLAESIGYSLIAAGTHPFSIATSQKVTQNERYLNLMRTLQWSARQFNIYGLHVHVGVNSPEKVIALLNQSVLYLPHLLALSASSPFWEGEDTGLMSVRSKIFEALSIAGIPYAFNSWDDYSRLVNHFIATSTIDTFREIWWDIRPHPDFGTLEWRVCDCPSTIDDIVTLTALVHALVCKLSEDFDRGMVHRQPHASIIKENKWRATRYGVHGQLIDPVSYGSVPLEKEIGMLLDELRGHAEDLGVEQYLARIPDLLRSGTSADRQRQVHADSGDLKAVVESLRVDLSR